MGIQFLIELKMKLGFGLIAFAAASKQYIIGGYEPSPNSEKYIVSLQRGGSHFCGGTVISSTRTVTAAHCYQTRVTAVAGAHNINVNESTQQKMSVTSFVNHPSYNDRNMQNDIAVLRHSAFNLGGAVAALAPRSSMPSSGAAVRICGWGNTAYPGTSYPSRLQCIDVAQSQPQLATAPTPMLVQFCLV